jgi:endo-1,4-beta-xylanase
VHSLTSQSVPARLAPLLAFALGALGCSRPPEAEATTAHEAAAPATPSLAERYADFFPIGAAIDAGSLQTHADLMRHFNSMTAENEMKFESLEKTEGVFDFSTADTMVAYAKERGMRVRGHTLVWHRQTPAWVFTDASGAPASPEVVMARLKKHIAAVVGHYKGQLYAWDVVNEAITDDGRYRTATEEREDQRSQWHGILGTSYIAAAFRAAHEADPDAKLYYNEFHNYIPAKRQAVYELLKQLLADGVPVHGVGLQSHLSIQPSPDPENPQRFQTVAEQQESIELYTSLGLDVQVTELDLSVYVPGVKYTPDQFYTLETFSDELKAKQADRYAEFFDLYRRYAKVISGVTFWGIADDNTWLSEFASGRKDFPLLFDVNHAPKPAFERVMTF